MEHIGIDVHKNQSQICILTPDGELIEKRIRTTRKRLHSTGPARTGRVGGTEATRQGWSKGNGGCDATMKLRISSGGCESRSARG